MLVEHSFVTVREMNDAFSDASAFLGSIGFEPPQLVAPSALETRRGLVKTGRGNRISTHPQQLRLEFDRGRIILGASVDVIGKPRPTHRAMLTSIAQGLELLLAQGADPDQARQPVEAAQRAILREHRRRRLVHNTVVSSVALAFLALIGAFAYAMTR